MEATDSIAVRSAVPDDIAELASLFDDYRMFYGEASARDEAMVFIREQVDAGKTRLMVARAPSGGRLVGFVHLMPSLNTLAMRPIWLVEDLFVRVDARRLGVASALMAFAEEFARAEGAERLTLATAHSNLAAQALYGRIGYVREEQFQYFHRLLR